MKIKFEGTYKSITSFETEELPDFVVITGKNGSGKSQLLELLNARYNSDNGTRSGVTISENISGCLLDQSISGSQGTGNLAQWENAVRSHFFIPYQQLNSYEKDFIQAMFEANIWIEDINPDAPYMHFDSASRNRFREINLLQKLAQNEKSGSKDSQKTILLYLNTISQKFIYSTSNKDKLYRAYEVAQFINKKFSELRESDFFNYNHPDINRLRHGQYRTTVQQIFFNYAKHRKTNRYFYFLKKEDKKDILAISDYEFVKMFDPPWDIINRIMIDCHLSYAFAPILIEEINDHFSYGQDLINLRDNSRISINALSTGEKIIFGLVCKLFTVSYYEGKVAFPAFLLLDEPDAYLHPEMSKLLIDVLQNVFVKKLGMKVVMTTHSPSTVAICPEESIYRLQNGSRTTLKPVSKDEILSELTAGIPNLSINYKNHKQVFVESPTDRFYYQNIFNRLKGDKQYPFDLYFIAYGKGKGNCTQVKELTKDMRAAGNESCYGIIDWDSENKTEEFVKVHGSDFRYSLENFVYDPVYLTLFFLDNESENSHKELRLDENSFAVHSIAKEESQELLQRFADWFYKRYYDKISNAHLDKSECTITYMNGWQVSVPKWALEDQGHDIETKLKKAFPSLSKKRPEGELQKELTKLICKCYPLIPKETEDLFDGIISTSL
jgi:energy-coupling factor transporter ATP-binding protein EcfA2